MGCTFADPVFRWPETPIKLIYACLWFTVVFPLLSRDVHRCVVYCSWCCNPLGSGLTTLLKAQTDPDHAVHPRAVRRGLVPGSIPSSAGLRVGDPPVVLQSVTDSYSKGRHGRTGCRVDG